MSVERDVRRLRRELDEARAEQRRERAEVAPDFLTWLQEVTPRYDWTARHIVHMRERLAQVDTGEVRRLMFFLPPRHGKSELVTVRYAAFCLQRDPRMRVILGAYNQRLVNKFSRQVRRLLRGRVEFARGATGVEDWELEAGGGLRAVGVGAGVTGHGGDLIVVDDPVKSREEAESKAYRERVWEWYTDDLYTRLEPGAVLVIINTRWHQDDLCGRILASEDAPNWTVVSLPAFAEEEDPLGRGEVPCPRCEGEPGEDGCSACGGIGTVGEALWPERFDEERLAQTKVILGRSFHALYQQRPRPREGDLFKWGWFDTLLEPPVEARRIRYWDTAGTEGRGDYTVGVLMSKTEEGLYTVEDVVRGQWSPGRRDEQIRAAADRDADRWGKYGFRIWLEHEAGVAGAERTRSTIQKLSGYRVHAERVTGSKTLRAEPLAAQAEAGNVRVLKRGWTTDFLNELCDFPTGAHDDQVDASSGAFNKLAEAGSMKVRTFVHVV